MYERDDWEDTYATVHTKGFEVPIQTLTPKGSNFPYYRYDIVFNNIHIDFLYRIEVLDYPTESGHWIPQLIDGKTVKPGLQWLSYSFWPSPFKDRDVCQTYCSFKRNDTFTQVAFRTVPFEKCLTATNETLVHMVLLYYLSP